MYLNNNAPNQENMDIRYFSKGLSHFNSLKFSLSSKYLYFIIEPYFKKNNYKEVKTINEYGPFERLNDYTLNGNLSDKNLRNFLLFVNYKGITSGFTEVINGGDQACILPCMTNNSWPMNSQIIGTMREIRLGKVGLYALFSFQSSMIETIL